MIKIVMMSLRHRVRSKEKKKKRNWKEQNSVRIKMHKIQYIARLIHPPREIEEER